VPDLTVNALNSVIFFNFDVFLPSLDPAFWSYSVGWRNNTVWD